MAFTIFYIKFLNHIYKIIFQTTVRYNTMIIHVYKSMILPLKYQTL